MATTPELTDDEYTVLDFLYEVGWEWESLGALRAITRDVAEVPRLRSAVGVLVDKGFVTIRQTRDFDPDYPGRPLSGQEATTALNDDGAWAIPGEPLFDGTTDYYVVDVRQPAIDAYWRAREAGRQHSCVDRGFASFD
jgi:hypothetical protein